MKMIIKEISVINYTVELYNPPSSHCVVELEHEKTIQDVYNSVMEYEREYNKRGSAWQLRIEEGSGENWQEWIVASSLGDFGPKQYRGPMSLKVESVTASRVFWGDYIFTIKLLKE